MPPKRRAPIAESTSKRPRGKRSLYWLPKPSPAQSIASQTSLITMEAPQANGVIPNGQENGGLGVNLKRSQGTYCPFFSQMRHYSSIHWIEVKRNQEEVSGSEEASGSEGESEHDGELDSDRESAKVISYIHLGEEID